MTTLTLYQISESLTSLLDSGIDQETGEISEELANHLGLFEDKGRGVVAYILNKEATAEAIGEAIRKLSKRQDAYNKSAQKLREYLLFNMQKTGTKEISAEDGTFCAKLYLERDESIEIFDEKQIPISCMVIPEAKPRPDKAAIKKLIKSGTEIPGAKLVKKDRLTIS